MHMKNSLRFLMLSTLATAVAPVFASDYTCVELELFAVDKNNIDDRESARAAMIPVEVLAELRTYIAVEIRSRWGASRSSSHLKRPVRTMTHPWYSGAP
jgi:hypothetical protein